MCRIDDLLQRMSEDMKNNMEKEEQEQESFVLDDVHVGGKLSENRSVDDCLTGEEHYIEDFRMPQSNESVAGEKRKERRDGRESRRGVRERGDWGRRDGRREFGRGEREGGDRGRRDGNRDWGGGVKEAGDWGRWDGGRDWGRGRRERSDWGRRGERDWGRNRGGWSGPRGKSVRFDSSNITAEEWIEPLPRNTWKEK